MKKRTKIIIAVLIALPILFLIGGLFAGNMLYNLALNPNQDKSVVVNADHNSIDTGQETDPEEKKAVKEWYENIKTEEYTMESRDKLSLKASVITQSSDKWAILCHGYSGEIIHNMTAAYHFYNQGYNILMPAARGHDISQGDYIGMGWDDRLDIVDWIHTIVDKNENAKIALYGVSMGGATVMMVSGEELPDNVKVIVEDCGYSSVWDEFDYQLDMIFGLPDFPVLNFASLVTKVRAGWWIGDASAVDQVKKSKTPMMFIHGDADTFVPSAMLDVVYEAANVPKEKLLVEGAGHGAAASILGQAYWDSIFEFVGKYIK